MAAAPCDPFLNVSAEAIRLHVGTLLWRSGVSKEMRTIVCGEIRPEQCSMVAHLQVLGEQVTAGSFSPRASKSGGV